MHELVDFLIDNTLLGHSRLSHMNALQTDQGYLIIKEASRLQDESIFRLFVSNLAGEYLPQFIALNTALLHLKASINA